MREPGIRRGEGAVWSAVGSLLKGEAGSSVLEMALVVPLLVLMLAGLIDLGRAYYLSIEVTSAANAGALYGVQNPTDLNGMKSAALLDAENIPAINVIATRGCECSDGSSVVPLCAVAPLCTVNVVSYVSVTTTLNYSPLITSPLLFSNLQLRGFAEMRAGR